MQSEYAERYCAFVDILGFRQLIEELASNPEEFEALRALLTKVHSPSNAPDATMQVQSISDAVALSTLVTASGLLEIVTAVQTLALDLLHEGYFLRGAVVKGRLYHDEQMAFGEALVRAYDFETEVARYPRVILTRAVYEDVVRYRANTSIPYPESLFRHASDGPAYVNVLESLSASIKKKTSPFHKYTDTEREETTRFLKMKDRIQKRFDESVDNPSHFKKVRWFARYWNEMIPATEREFPRISGPGLMRPV